MQYSLLRVLKSNFIRIKEQQKNADSVGLIYFPLKYSDSKLTELEVNDNSNDDNDNIDLKNDENVIGEEKKRRNKVENKVENCPYSHLPVFQLLRSLLHCIACKSIMISPIKYSFLLRLQVYLFIHENNTSTYLFI